MLVGGLPTTKAPCYAGVRTPIQTQKQGALQPAYHTSAVGNKPHSAPVLVQCAISHRREALPSAGFSVDVYADLLKVRKQPVTIKSSQQHRSQRFSRRGIVRSFSRKSRKRMIERLAMLRSVAGGFFVTLTYPDDVEHSGRKAKRDLDALTKRLRRRFPSVGGIWRLELKRRKSGERTGEIAPHFHILLFGWHQREQLVRMWLQLAWSRIVYETNDPPRRVRTRADVISSRKHAARYASKYAAKLDDELDDEPENLRISQFGRRWGTFGALNCAAAVTLTLSWREAVELRRMCARWLHAKRSRFERPLVRGSPHQGFAVLGLGDQSSGTIQRMLQFDSVA